MGDEVVDKNRRMFLGASAQGFSGAALAGAAQGAPSGAGAVKEPAAIGYANSKGVVVERVSYPARNLGTTIVANLFKPAGFDPVTQVRRGGGDAFVRRRQGANRRSLRSASGRGGLPHAGL